MSENIVPIIVATAASLFAVSAISLIVRKYDRIEELEIELRTYKAIVEIFKRNHKHAVELMTLPQLAKLLEAEVNDQAFDSIVRDF